METFSRISKSSSIPNPAAEAKDGTPVASGSDSTPTDWFGLAVELCHNSRRAVITDLLEHEVIQ